MAKGTNGTGRRALGGGKDKTLNSGQRPTAGVPGRPDAPSGTEFRTGMLEQKAGMAVPDPLGVMGMSTRKSSGTTRTSGGARLRISPNVNAVAKAEPLTQKNLRTVPSVMGSRPNFWGGSRG